MKVLVIGGSRGIGKHLLQSFFNSQKNQNLELYGTCRSTPSQGDSTDLPHDKKTHWIESVDLSSDDFESSLLAQVSGLKFDLVIHNAGILHSQDLSHFTDKASRQESLTRLRQQFEINSIAPLRTISALLAAQNIQSGSKVVLITSRMGSIQDNSTGGSYGYRMSKCAANMLAKSLSIDLTAHGIPLAVIHPGYVKTDMTNGNGYITPQQSADMIIKLIENQKTFTSNPQELKFWHSDGTVLPW